MLAIIRARRPGAHGSPATGVRFVCEWPACGIAESRADTDAQLILDAARRSVRLWPENED